MSSLTIAPGSLRQVRERLLTLDPDRAPEWLRAAGTETGALLLRHFQARLAHRTGLDDPALLDARWLGPLLGESLAETGWGAASLVDLGDDAILLDAPEWAESGSGAPAGSGCHFSVGMLTALFSGLAGTPVAVVEVECRATGASACRFAVGADDMAAVWRDVVAAGGDWRTTISTPHQG